MVDKDEYQEEHELDCLLHEKLEQFKELSEEKGFEIIGYSHFDGHLWSFVISTRTLLDFPNERIEKRILKRFGIRETSHSYTPEDMSTPLNSWDEYTTTLKASDKEKLDETIVNFLNNLEEARSLAEKAYKFQKEYQEAVLLRRENQKEDAIGKLFFGEENSLSEEEAKAILFDPRLF